MTGGAPTPSERPQPPRRAAPRRSALGAELRRAAPSLLVAALSLGALLLVVGPSGLDANGGLEAMRLGGLAILLIGIAGAWALRRDVQPLLGRPRVSASGLAQAALGLALVWLASFLLSRVAPTTDGALVAVYHARELPLWLAIVDLALLPAVAEELVFRGVVLTSLLKVLGPTPAVVVTALLFGVVHLAPLSVVHLTMMGLVLGAVRVTSGSLLAAVALHALYNAVVVLTVW